jgi:hypothetical protein
MRVGSGLQAAAGGAARAKENREHSTISRSNTHEVLPQDTARSVDVSFRCPPVTSRRRQRTHARASTPKGERACRAANASQEKPTRGRQQHTPPTTTAWQKLRAAPTPPRGRHLPFEGHDHSPTPLQQNPRPLFAPPHEQAPARCLAGDRPPHPLYPMGPTRSLLAALSTPPLTSNLPSTPSHL